MDLKSMLNESAGQRPSRLQTPQSSYDVPSTATNEAYPNRSSPYPGPPQLTESRSQSAPYFGQPSLSPHQPQQPAGSLSTGAQSAYSQSPGPFPQGYLSREHSGAHQPYSNPGVNHSPSAAVHHPPTPGGSHQYQSHTPGSAHSQQSLQNQYPHPVSPHGSSLPNGHEYHQARQISPHAQGQHPPQTPLGPPVAYNRASPHVQRPTSQGIDQHYRKNSYGSTGSGHDRVYSHPQSQPQQEAVRAQSAQRKSFSESEKARERDHSLSVSPKTIPKPSPIRQMSSTSINTPQSQPEARSTPVPYRPQDRLSEVPNMSPTPASSAHSNDLQRASREQSAGPAQSNSQAYPRPKSIPVSSPSSTHRDSPITAPQISLKRNASLMSDGSGIVQQPRKRLRRDEIPLWAESVRRRPPKFGDGTKKARFAPTAATAPQPAPRPAQPSPTNGHSTNEAKTAESNVSPEMKWEPTIANVVPEDDLSMAIAHWIHSHIGSKVPPAGAVFEIEAKVGAICDTQTGERIRLPVRSECITAVDLPHTKFESSMDMEQHQKLNQYLNNLAQIAYNDPNREPVRPCHLRQYDDFFELTHEGLDNLSPGLVSNRSRKPRVRKTTDKDTGQVRAMIVKTRIDDLEVYNPVHDFDFRISISIETNWSGDPSWLIPIQNANARTRLKDRMSYRHGAIQVDLTQVSHEESQRMEHELEVEVSVAMLQAELEKERADLPSRFGDLVKSLVDNARLLCRQGSLYRRR